MGRKIDVRMVSEIEITFEGTTYKSHIAKEDKDYSLEVFNYTKGQSIYHGVYDTEKDAIKTQFEILKTFVVKDGPVMTICYGTTRTWESRTEAMRFFREGMYACEGSERDRYVNVYMQLQSGAHIAKDE